ncbi:hypothetical protein AB0D67_07440 [Streptosporangium sp. NPDC048047]|uniref:hypothetical protein n=1 Tax=Streptosporangium sp. NPDC048047 TaxID=3155748 RepID=UPI0034450E5D
MAARSTSVPRGKRGGGPGELQEPHVTVPVIGRVTLPPPEHLAFYAVLGVLGALEIIDWPVVLVIGAGHLLAGQRRSRVLRGAGEAAEAA